jgi:hypothetical protein
MERTFRFQLQSKIAFCSLEFIEMTLFVETTPLAKSSL